MVFDVTIREMVSKKYTIAADSEEMAQRKIKDRYHKGEINMSNGDKESVQVQIHNRQNNFYTDWLDI